MAPDPRGDQPSSGGDWLRNIDDWLRGDGLSDGEELKPYFGLRQHVISDRANGARSVIPVDLDGDGDMDVLAASSVHSQDVIEWFENTDGAGRFGPAREISTGAGGNNSIFAADVDGDGDMDVLATSYHETFGNSKIVWHENTDGAGNFGTERSITTLADRPRSVFASDIDGDGDADVLSASERDNTIAWYENVDGSGNFGPQQVITTLARNARWISTETETSMSSQPRTGTTKLPGTRTRTALGVSVTNV